MNTEAKKKARKKWSEKNPEYKQKYKAEHPDRIAESNSKYYTANRESINQQRKQTYTGDKRQEIIQKAKDRYQRDPQKILAANKNRLLLRREKIAAIALHYGCQNPNCRWQGDFIPAQLQFHHLAPGEKEYNVSMMAGMKLKRVAAEINKCCVLCACCHIAIRMGQFTYEGKPCHVNDNLEIE